MKEKIIIIGGGQAAANAINTIRNINDEISNITGDFVDEYEVERIVERKVEGLVDYDDFKIDLNVLKDRLSILENKNNNKSLLSDKIAISAAIMFLSFLM